MEARKRFAVRRIRLSVTKAFGGLPSNAMPRTPNSGYFIFKTDLMGFSMASAFAVAERTPATTSSKRNFALAGNSLHLKVLQANNAAIAKRIW